MFFNINLRLLLSKLYSNFVRSSSTPFCYFVNILHKQSMHRHHFYSTYFYNFEKLFHSFSSGNEKRKSFSRIPIFLFFVLPFFIYPLSTVLTVYVGCGANESGFKMRLFSCNKNPINETISGWNRATNTL